MQQGKTEGRQHQAEFRLESPPEKELLAYPGANADCYGAEWALKLACQVLQALLNFVVGVGLENLGEDSGQPIDQHGEKEKPSSGGNGSPGRTLETKPAIGLFERTFEACADNHVRQPDEGEQLDDQRRVVDPFDGVRLRCVETEGD